MIIPVYHVITTQYPIAASTTIEPGQVVALDTNGYAVKADADGANNLAVPIGLSADRNRAAESYEYQNRLSDMGNQTAASGMLSVYTGVGSEFYVDIDDSTITTPNGTAISGVVVDGLTLTPGTKLYVWTGAGQLHTTQTSSGMLVAIVTEAEQTLASGIPGEYEPGSSVAYADDAVSRSWVKIKLMI